MQKNDASPNGKDLGVFSIVRDSKCSECQEELGKGQFLMIENGKPFCMKCADLEHLVFLGSGDAALSRRAKKHSKLWAVVVRFSRARKRYERQGLLVEEDALAKAEEECLADRELREARRIRDEERRFCEDEALVREMEVRLKEMFPGCPSGEARAIAQHASIRGSGRVGRSAAGKNLEEEALRLAAIAFIRHRHTTYDDLLMNGMDRASARQSVWDKIEETLQHWSKR